MAGNSPDSVIIEIFKLIVSLLRLGLYIAGFLFLIIIFIAYLGASITFLTGSAPSLLQPTGGWLVGFLVTLIEIGGLLLALFIAWLVFSGKVDEIIDPNFLIDSSNNSSSSSKQGGTKSRSTSQNSTRDQRSSQTSSSSTAHVYSNHRSSSGSDDDDEFDEYGQIKE